MHHGVQVFEIIDNGKLLSGVFTNTFLAPKYIFDCEIAEKAAGEKDGLEGNYNFRYINRENGQSEVFEGVLHIQKVESTYVLTWREGNRVTWTGIGLKAGNNHLAISYIKAQ